MKRIPFFALKSDLLLVLRDIESKRSVKYVSANTFATGNAEQWPTGHLIPDLGRAAGEQAAACKMFLITYPELPVQLRRVKRDDGRTSFIADQLSNPDTITVVPAGKWKDNIIIAGAFGTASESAISQALMRTANAAVKRHFTKVRAFWVGPEALIYLRSGKRLTIAEQSPSVLDLGEEQPGGWPRSQLLNKCGCPTSRF
jgi:hypothetical protein